MSSLYSVLEKDLGVFLAKEHLALGLDGKEFDELFIRVLFREKTHEEKVRDEADKIIDMIMNHAPVEEIENEIQHSMDIIKEK